MADKNIVRMNDRRADAKKASGEEKVGDFLARNLRVLVWILAAGIAAIVIYVIAFNIYTSGVRKNLDKIEVIEYSLTKDGADLDDAMVSSRLETALNNLNPYLSKGGIAGARADMLAADIYVQKKDWEKAKDNYLLAASKKRGTYIESLCNFNAAAACEELGKTDEALELYRKVSEDKDFVDRSRAYFNAGRLLEGKQDYEGARASYEAIANLDYSNDAWNDLAKTRVLRLRMDGKIN